MLNSHVIFVCVVSPVFTPSSNAGKKNEFPSINIMYKNLIMCLVVFLITNLYCYYESYKILLSKYLGQCTFGYYLQISWQKIRCQQKLLKRGNQIWDLSEEQINFFVSPNSFNKMAYFTLSIVFKLEFTVLLT